MRLSHYHLIAELFDYPSADFADKVKDLLKFLRDDYPETARNLEAFYRLLPFHDHEEALDEMQELYTRSFDVQAITTLDIGYTAFGDDYKRGELLVHLNREHKQAGNDCGTELADHLPNILRLIGVHEDRQLVEELVREILAPAMQKMIAEFDPQRVAKKNEYYRKHYKTLIEISKDRDRIYHHALLVLYAVLDKDFSLPEPQPPEKQSDFLRSVGREMEIETNPCKSVVEKTSWPC